MSFVYKDVKAGKPRPSQGKIAVRINWHTFVIRILIIAMQELLSPSPQAAPFMTMPSTRIIPATGTSLPWWYVWNIVKPCETLEKLLRKPLHEHWNHWTFHTFHVGLWISDQAISQVFKLASLVWRYIWSYIKDHQWKGPLSLCVHFDRSFWAADGANVWMQS
jgi:hypothetical protein